MQNNESRAMRERLADLEAQLEEAKEQISRFEENMPEYTSDILTLDREFR